VLRKIFGAKRDKVTGGWKRLHNEKLNDLYSPNIFRVTKSRKMRWSGHVTYGGEERCIQNFSGETCGKETTWKIQA
jgi:hypothetical protein